MPIPRSCNIPIRQSRRLSVREPIIHDDDGGESFPGELLYPDSDSDTPSPESTSRTVQPKSPARRAPHSPRRSNSHIPRPPNAFVCFRSELCERNKKLGKNAVHNQRAVSKLAGIAWHALSPDEREIYEAIAEEKKKLHAEKYPNYAYSPTSRSGGKSKKRKANGDHDHEEHVPQSKRRRTRAYTQIHGTPLSPTDHAEVESYLARSSAPSPELDRPQTPELSSNSSSSSESPDADVVLRTPAITFPQAFEDDAFVPTADIPVLDLYDSENKIEPPRSCFKPDIPRENRDTYMWYAIDGSYTEPALAAAPSLAAATTSKPVVEALLPINYAEVQFTNPFAPSVVDFATPFWPINYGEMQTPSPFAASDFALEVEQMFKLG